MTATATSYSATVAGTAILIRDAPSIPVESGASTHYYTVCYNNNTSTITKRIDGGLIYTATNWKWSGPNPNTTI